MGVGIWRDSVIYATSCITESSEERIVSSALSGKSSVVSEMRSEAVLGI